MAMILRPLIPGFLLSLPLCVTAASPWKVTDGSTLRVTSGYSSVEDDDIPLQVSGPGSHIITDSDLTFSTTAQGFPVAAVTAQGNLTLNKATLQANGKVIRVESGTLTINDSSLTMTIPDYATIVADNSNVTLKNTSITTEAADAAIAAAGGKLDLENVTIEGNVRAIGNSIKVQAFNNIAGEATLKKVRITTKRAESAPTISVFQGHVTGTDITIDSANDLQAAIKVGHGFGTKSTLTLSDSTITTRYVGIRTMAGDVLLNNVDVTTTATGNNYNNNALELNMDSDGVVRGGRYRALKDRSYALYMANDNTTLDAANASFSTQGKRAHAFNAAYGSAIVTDSEVTTSGFGSYGLYTLNSIKGNGVTVTTSGNSSVGAVAESSSSLSLTNTHINTSGDYAFGVYGYAAKDVSLDHSFIKTEGNTSYGVRAQRSPVTLKDTTVLTNGKGAYAIFATDSSNVNIHGGKIVAAGRASTGIYAGSGASVTAADVAVTASGDNAFALISALGNINLTNSNIANTGAASGGGQSAGLYADDYSDSLINTVTLDKTTLLSEAGRGVWVKGSALNLTLNNGSVVYGGNGIALGAEAADNGKGGFLHSTVNVTANGASQLHGDIVVDNHDSMVNLMLNDGSTLNGATQNVNKLLLNSASSWLVTADSNLNTLALNGGKVIFNNASGFSTIGVNGDLSGSGAFAFTARLDGDDSPGDRLLVHGNASGNYDVSVINQGGAGALTHKGILLVRVEGDASAAAFRQKNTVVAGNYEYFLEKSGDKAWYLQSSLTPAKPDDTAAESDKPSITPVAPNDEAPAAPNDEAPAAPNNEAPAAPDDKASRTPDTVTPAAPDSVSKTETSGPDVIAYRPETAGYLIAPYLNSTYGFDTIGTWHERLGAYQGTTAWARVSGRHDRYATGRFAFNVNTTFVQLGGDIVTRQFTDGWHLAAGPIMTLGHQRSSNQDTARRLRPALSVDVGKVTTNTYGIGGYLTTWNDSGAYLDNVIQLTRYSNEFSSLTRAQMNSYGIVASMETGIPFSAGGLFRLEPQLQVMGQFMHISQAHADGVKLKAQNLTTGRLREGLRFYYDNPVLKPYLQADMVQFLGHTPGVDMNNETMRPDVRRGYWQLGGGLSSQLNPHFSVYAQVKYAHSFGAGTEGYTGNLGMRYQF